MTRTARSLVLGALLALLAAAPAAADEGGLVAGALQYDASSRQTGLLGMFFANDAKLDEGGQQVTTGARPWIDLQAAAIEAVQYEERETLVTAAGLPTVPVPETGESSQVPSSFGAARGHLTRFQPGFEVHIYSLGETALPYEAETQGGRIGASENASMSPGIFGEDSIPANSPRDSTFATLVRPGPWIIGYELSPATSVVLQGDFVVELFGITLQVDSDQGPQVLESGQWSSPAAGTPPAQGVAADTVRRFVRLRLTDATLEFATDSGSPTIAWAVHDFVGTFDGPVAMTDARGPVRTKAGDIDLRHERYVAPAGSLLQVVPDSSEALAVQVEEAPLSPKGGTLASVPAPASAALIGAGAILALGIAIGIGVLRRVLRLPALADVETAIEEGAYGKAARLAGRILARLPGSEEALLGRAIALSKAGQPQAVVAEVTRHLASRPASDGTLHYVLGLAQLETGQASEGQASLREAVRLTPSLQAEVAPRLGKAFSVAPTTTRETHGYA